MTQISRRSFFYILFVFSSAHCHELKARNDVGYKFFLREVFFLRASTRFAEFFFLRMDSSDGDAYAVYECDELICRVNIFFLFEYQSFHFYLIFLRFFRFLLLLALPLLVIVLGGSHVKCHDYYCSSTVSIIFYV